MLARMRGLPRQLAVICAAVALVAGCQGGGEEASSPAPSSAAPSVTQVTPAPDSVAVQQLSFVPPDGFHQVTDEAKRTHEQAAYESIGEPSDPSTVDPTIYVFVERADVGPVSARRVAFVNMANLQFEDVQIVRDEPVQVPGAEAAHLVEVTYTCGEGTGEYQCHQIELLVQRPQNPQFGLRIGMAEADWDAATVDALLSSVRVTG